MNRQRDELPSLLRSKVIIWLTDRAAAALMAVARDLFDIFITFFRFEAIDQRTTAMTPGFSPNLGQYATVEEESRFEREIELLTENLADAERDPRTAADNAPTTDGRFS